MSVTATIVVQAELSTGVWTAITADVLAAHGLTAEYGIRGQRPTDRIAQVGKMKFSLDNSVGNIGAAQGYYAPGNAAVASGWEISTAIRLKITYGGTDYYKFLGKVADLDVATGIKKKLDVKVKVEDWMRDASTAKVQLLPVQEDQRTDEVITTLVAAMDAQPRATSYATAQETLPSALDDVKDGRTAIKTALQRAVLSEFGFLMLIGDTTGGGTLKFQDRHARVKDQTVQITLTAADIASLKFQHDKKLIFNEVRAKVFPRDEGASVETLGQLDTPLEIPAGDTDTIRLQYRDPDLLDAKLSGKDMYCPEGKNELVVQGSADARGFEGGVGGWIFGGGGSRAQSSTQAKVGTYSLKATSGTGAAEQNYLASPIITGFSQNDIVYYQGYIFVEEAWPDGKIYVDINERNAGGSLVRTNVGEVATTGGWVRINGQYTVTNGGTDRLRFEIGQTPTAGNGDFSGGAVDLYIDEVYAIHDTELNFIFSASEAGDGGTLNDNLELIGSTIGGSGAEFVAKNTGGASGYLIVKARGTAIRLYNPVERVAIDATSQTDHDEQPLPLNLAYQSGTRVGQDFADVTLQRYKDPQGWVKAVTFHANRSDALMTAALAVEPGQRIAITEAVSGLSSTELFVNAVKLKIYNKGFIDCTWFVVPASTEQYWLCGTAGASEIGETTYVGF